MPSTRMERRRDATKRQIMDALRDSTNSQPHNDGDSDRHDNNPSSYASSLHDNPSDDIDGTNEQHVRLMVQDLKQQLARQKELLAAETQRSKEEQHYAHSTVMIQLTKSIKKMTVREYNAAHNCDLLALLLKTNNVKPGGGGNNNNNGTKKRIRQELETPAPLPRGNVAKEAAAVAPSTVRTVRRGETIFSKNGSPVDTVDEGTLVATVSKKRRGKSSIVFDINVGEGRYINLADPGTVKHLDSEMKTEAKSQLMAMQEQMAVLMAQLET